MAELKTKQNDGSVDEFIQGIADEGRRSDSQRLVELMSSVTGDEPVMWGDNIVGFGKHHYKYESGREGDWFCVGFSPRKQTLTIYLTYGFEEQRELLQRLGKHKTGKACLYLSKLEGVDMEALRELVRVSAEKQRGSRQSAS